MQAGRDRRGVRGRHPVDAHGCRDADAAAVAVARLAARVAARGAGGVRRLRQRPVRLAARVRVVRDLVARLLIGVLVLAAVVVGALRARLGLRRR